jgi:NAD(P)-dependent dehydrogenase (short-subunit alcohol dehydrogenase family)
VRTPLNHVADVVGEAAADNDERCDPEGGERAAKTIAEAGGGTAVFHADDVSNPQAVDAVMQKVVETYGRLDCAFNNAGIEGHMAPGTARRNPARLQ